MSDRDALLAAILANPAEDTPRLVYADWLQENGEPARGEFVRLQVGAAQAEPFSPQARECEAAAQRLLAKNVQAWTRHISDHVVGQRFVRGFVGHAVVNAATFARDAPALFAVEPVDSLQVMRFAFTTATVSLDPFLNSPHVARVARLDLSALGRHADDFEPLASAAPRLTALTDLGLRDRPVPPAWLRALLASSDLPALAGLDLADNVHLPRVLAEALPKADHRRFLRLDLSYVSFQSDHIQKALSGRSVRELEELRFCWRKSVGAGPLTHMNLGWAIPWGKLRVLDLDGQGLIDESVHEMIAELSRRPGLAPLRWLGLANNGLRADAVRALVNSSGQRLNLYHLDLRGNGLAGSHRAALAERFPDAVVLV
ncbi:MAG: TIGR02996 domain-containing protein [Gemmata sp.]